VIDDLPVGVLLGNDFLFPYEANIDYSENRVIFSKINGLLVKFDVVVKSNSYIRKVTT
ncbi:hypothetical protein QBC39DRAFT_248656, partial [Podospora conica]